MTHIPPSRIPIQARLESESTWRLKKPVSQYAFGRPVLSHLLSWSWRCSRPRNQLPRVAASQLFFSHSLGMRAVNRASSDSARLAESAIVPAPFTHYDRLR